MQKEVLEKDPKAGLRVYAVWSRNVPTDDRARWPGDVLKDGRVTHLWDEGRVVGGWFAARKEFLDDPKHPLWDAYLLFGPDAKWGEAPSHLVNWGYTILMRREQLRADLERVR